MAFVFNPLTGLLDEVNGLAELTGIFVRISGDTMTGSLDLQKNALILQASDNSRWQVTVNTTGNLVTTKIVPSSGGGQTGVPIGFANFGLTYP